LPLISLGNSKRLRCKAAVWAQAAREALSTRRGAAEIWNISPSESHMAPLMLEHGVVTCPEGGGSSEMRGKSCFAEGLKSMEHYVSPEAKQADCGVAVALASMAALGKIIAPRCVPPTNGQPLTCFDSLARPRAQLPDYARMLAKHLECSRESFILTLVYIDRLLDLNPDFLITALSAQKLFLTGVVVAAKFHDDEYMTNQHYAHVGGLRTHELNSLEAQFLKLLHWRLVVSPQECEAYREQVLLTGDGFGQELLERRHSGRVVHLFEKIDEQKEAWRLARRGGQMVAASLLFVPSDEPPLNERHAAQQSQPTPPRDLHEPPRTREEAPSPATALSLVLPLAEPPVAHCCGANVHCFLDRCSRCGSHRPSLVSRRGFRRFRHLRAQGRPRCRCICLTPMSM